MTVSMGELTPVSYTHLRAHETVLDLVCRLLLEKKTITLPSDRPATTRDTVPTTYLQLSYL